MTRTIRSEGVERGYGPVILRRNVECVGTNFLSYRQSLQGITNNEFNQTADEDFEKENRSSIFDEEDINYLRSLEPKDWKTQDHYSVLGLGRVRYRATQDDIKKAYRLKALKHHPDKRGHENISPDSDYFTCIIKAWEILGNPKTRRSYDSVDQKIDDKIPPNNEHSRVNFFKVFEKAFDRNSRWSKEKNVPKLGTETSTREHVDQFYSFWYNFQSWREFTYNDDDDDNYEKRAKQERKMRKEEQARIRKLVDLAYSLDPRIAVFKREEKERKQAVKNARRETFRAHQEESERKEKEMEELARKAKEEEELKKKAIEISQKAEKNALKRALKESRKAFCKVVKANKYYAERPDEAINHMLGLDIVCQEFSAQKLTHLTAMLEKNGRETYIAAVQEATIQQKEKQEKFHPIVPPTKSPTRLEESPSNIVPWSRSQLQLLIKATNIFPVGTQKRWEVIADFINQLYPEVTRSYKEVSAKAKELKSSDPFKNAEFFQCYENTNKNKSGTSRKDVCSELTQRDVTHENEQKKSSIQSWVEQTMKTVLSFTQGVVGGNVESGEKSKKKDRDGKGDTVDISNVKENSENTKVEEKAEKLTNVEKPVTEKTEKNVENEGKHENRDKSRNTVRTEHVKRSAKVENVINNDKIGQVTKLDNVKKARRERSVKKDDKLKQTKEAVNIDHVKTKVKRSNLKEKNKRKKVKNDEKPILPRDPSFGNPEREKGVDKTDEISCQNIVDQVGTVDSVNVLYKFENYNVVDALDSVVDVVFNTSADKIDKVETVNTEEREDNLELMNERVNTVKREESADKIERVNKLEVINVIGSNVNLGEKLNNGDKVDIANKSSKTETAKLEHAGDRVEGHHGDIVGNERNLSTVVNKGVVIRDRRSSLLRDNDESPPWVDEEQQRLERAMKLYPSGTPKRWDQIADVVQTRDKAECMRRCIQLVAMVRAKRARNTSDVDSDR